MRTISLSLMLGTLALSALGCGQDEPDETDLDTDTDTDSDTDTDTGPYDGPWEVLAAMPVAVSAWPAVGVLGTEVHVVPSNSVAHWVYQTSDDSWRQAADLPRGAHYHAGAALDGKFYVLGGGTPGAIESVDWNFVYDPETDGWSEAAPLPTPRGYLAALALAGEIYTIGGPNISGETFTRMVEIYTPGTDVWRTGALLPASTMWPLYSSLSVVDGKIYRLGGGIANSPSREAWVYDPGSDAWSALPDVPALAHGPGGASLGTTAYLVGGYVNGEVSTRVIAYDTVARTYADAPAMPEDVAYQAVVAVDGCLYSIGGFHPDHADATARILMRWCPDG